MSEPLKHVGWYKPAEGRRSHALHTRKPGEGWDEAYRADGWQPVYVASSPDPWRRAIDDALVSAGLDCLAPDADPREAIDRLINWCMKIALDPTVSDEAQALIEHGKAISAAAAGNGGTA